MNIKKEDNQGILNSSESKQIIQSSQIIVEMLTLNVIKDHIEEIFGQFGKIDDIELFSDAMRNNSFQIAKIIYENINSSKKAIKTMEGGMIDQQEIIVKASKK